MTVLKGWDGEFWSVWQFRRGTIKSSERVQLLFIKAIQLISYFYRKAEVSYQVKFHKKSLQNTNTL